MASQIKFNFENLEYQEKAVNSVVNLFGEVTKSIDNTVYSSTINAIRKSIQGDLSRRRNVEISSGKKLKENLRKVQLENNLILNDEVEKDEDVVNFTVEMETGTGKTYVYLKTILDLYKKYDGNFKKFIIVVPTVPIRLGVEKSIDMLKEHFAKNYDGIDISQSVFVYDSKIKNIAGAVRYQFVDNKDLSILVMNTQAFNKDTNILRNSEHENNLEDMSVWDEIAQLHPVVIVDEPQKFDGGSKSRKSKRTASLKAIDEIKPSFILRYSATHNQIINPVYKLDSYHAYKEALVKRIRVKTVKSILPKDFPYIKYIAFNPRTLSAKIEMFCAGNGKDVALKTFEVRSDKNSNLYELSGELSQYRNFRIAENPHKEKPLKINANGANLELVAGSEHTPFTESELIRNQMKIAIRSHFEQQYNLLKSGKEIKALSLFFIDKVSKVRGENGEDGEYLKIFDAVYNEVIADSRYNKLFKEFPEYFADEYKNTAAVRQGYFAVDKKAKSTKIMEIEGWNEDGDDDSQKISKKQKEYIEKGIELILEKKDELISFDTPLAFIFSHSALREGWDNPNVFTLCTLKSSSNSIAKKQEIGRGLRLPVDIYGDRCHDENLNVLTVIANDSYENFTKKLQKSYDEDSGFKRDEVTTDIIMRVFKDAGIPIEKISSSLATAFKKELEEAGIMTKSGILNKEKAHKLNELDFTDATLKEHASKIKELFVEKMEEKGSKKISIENGDLKAVENKMNSYISEEDFREFMKAVNDRLSIKTVYKVKIDKDQFINDTVDKINEALKHKSLSRTVITSDSMHYIDENNRAGFTEANEYVSTYDVSGEVPNKSDFEIINYIMSATDLPRLAIYKILKGTQKRSLLNSQDYLDEVLKIVKKEFLKQQVESDISYDVLTGYQFDGKTIFGLDEINATELADPDVYTYKAKTISRKAVNEYYKFDSKGELKFAESLDDDSDVLLFTKIKKGGFVISTPYGNYSPDWAVVCKNNDGKAELYFVVETKIDKDYDDLSDVEKIKISCAKAHFIEVEKYSKSQINFTWANSYRGFKETVSDEKKL